MSVPAEQNIQVGEILSEIARLGNVPDILRLMEKICIDLGANRFSYHLTPKLRSQTDRAIHLVAKGFSRQWLALYEQADFRKHDPIPDIIMQHGEPMLWQDAIIFRRLNAQEQAFVRQLDAHGLQDGIGIPLFGPKGRNAYSAFTFEEADMLEDSQKIATIAALSSAAHVRICNILEHKDKNTVQLSERESQVIQLIANGRSNRAIASDLNIGGATADTYVRRVFAKLDVSDRIGASIRALELGILRL